MDSEDKFINDAASEDDQTEASVQVQSYVTVLKEEEIRELMESEIQRVSEIYSISKAVATHLLPVIRRDDGKFYKEWFDNEKKVRESVGIFDQHPPSEKALDKEFVCGVCSELHPVEKSASVSCGERVCTYCWTRIISNIINDVSASDWSLRLKCPYVSCKASVDRDMIERFASEEEKSKYNRYLLKSYIADTKTMKLCPRVASGRSCVFADDSRNSAVHCVCSLNFCWNCISDVHSPVDCQTAAQWNVSNTVPCPKCKRRIAVNQIDFSLKMTCLPLCNYDFCWLCRGDWTGHEEETCNNDAASPEEADQLWKMAGSASNRYKDCYENWESNELLMQKAKENLKKLDTVNLSETWLATEPELKFIVEAVLQIMECRRVLKWTYVYEYYLREDEVEKQNFLKQDREYAKSLVEKLTEYVESELPLLLTAEEPIPSQNFNEFRINLSERTSLTRTHYERLVRDIENGFPNVVPASNRSQRAYNGEASGSGSNRDD